MKFVFSQCLVFVDIGAVKLFDNKHAKTCEPLFSFGATRETSQMPVQYTPVDSCQERKPLRTNTHSAHTSRWKQVDFAHTHTHAHTHTRTNRGSRLALLSLTHTRTHTHTHTHTHTFQLELSERVPTASTHTCALRSQHDMHLCDMRLRM